MLRTLFIIMCVSVSMVTALPGVQAADLSELLRYEVTWNGNKAGHGDITAVNDSGQIKVTAQAVSDGVFKALIELWSRVQAGFTPRTYKPLWYQFHLKSNLAGAETVQLAFDHKTSLVQVNKQRGHERESHSENFSGIYDPITAIYLLRSKDLTKPMYVDIYDGKDKSRLYVNLVGPEPIKVRAGAHEALCLNLRLNKLGGDRSEIATGKLWVSNDTNRIPLLLTSSPIFGSIRLELVHAQL